MTWFGMFGANQAPVALLASQGFALDLAGGSAVWEVMMGISCASSPALLAPAVLPLFWFLQ